MPALGSNTAYLVTVAKGAAQPGQGASANMVTANAMAKLNIEIQNHWVGILEALGLSSGAGSSSGLGQVAQSLFGAAQIFSGYNLLPQILTSQVWRYSSGVQLALQMRFDAWDDPVTDVLLPVQKLIQMYMPTRANGGAAGSGILSSLGGAVGTQLSGVAASQFLQPPGPTPAQYLLGDTSRLFTVNLNNVFIIPQLIPTTISWEFEDRFDTNGHPMAAMIALGFMSYVTPDAATLLSWFTTQATAATSASQQTATPTGS